jgi:VanZ family protein
VLAAIDDAVALLSVHCPIPGRLSVTRYMPQQSPRRSAHFGLQLPLVVLVLAFTAIPIEVRPLTLRILARFFVVNLDVADIVANILLYVPFGLAFASRGVWATLKLAAGVSLFSEACQLFSQSRTSGLTDVGANVLGAIVGLVITWWWKPDWRMKPPQLTIGRVKAAIAGALALGYVAFGASVTPLQVEQTLKRVGKTPRLLWLEVSARGSTAAGRLEGRWTFEDTPGGLAIDVSGNGLQGRLVNQPTVGDGVHGRSLTFNGVNQYVDLGHPTALQLTGSETITAWIKASSFPDDDAAVVSSHSGLGYQLDTTIDRGPRTIGFRLADADGGLMARFGKTPLVLNTWYHIAGVYDAQAQSLNVYLNGERDNGCLLGTVTNRQRVSGMNTYVGRRASHTGFEFSGSIADVQVFSRALTQGEIQADFTRTRGAGSSGAPGKASTNPDDSDIRCSTEKTPADSRSVGVVTTFGLLVSLAILGFSPAVSRRTLCVACFAIGFVLFPTVGATLPAGHKWLLPILTLAGGASTAFSSRSEESPD